MGSNNVVTRWWYYYNPVHHFYADAAIVPCNFRTTSFGFRCIYNYKDCIGLPHSELLEILYGY